MLRALIISALAITSSAQGGVIEDSGVKGGLAVVVGCENTEAISELAADEHFLVQALDTDGDKVETTRRFIRKGGHYGRASATRLDGKTLPYADNVVNLVVMPDTGRRIPDEEILRVLAPGGVCLINGKKTAKDVPSDIDEWTHYLYDAKNNAASHDARVQTPTSMQWVSGPRWSRHHDHMSSVSAVVTAAGRIFSIMDEGSDASIQYPADWQLTARDAFSGTLLWKRSIPTWHTSLWPAKGGPAQLPRRLVAVGDKVYVTLGIHASVSMLDAATGKTLNTITGTEHTEEILVDQDQLFVTAHAKAPPNATWKLNTVQCWTEKDRAVVSRPWRWKANDPKKIIAVNTTSAMVLWSKETTVAPITLGVAEKHVVYHNGKHVVCLDRQTGNELWTSDAEFPLKVIVSSAPNLVLYKNVVLFSAGPGQVSALSIEDGKKLWTGSHGPSGHHSTRDLLVADGLVWSTSKGKPAKGGNGRTEPPTKILRERWHFIGRDPVSGEVKRTFPPGKSEWFHHRCHRGRATDNYLMMARTGIEYVNLKTGEWQPNPWVRGACLYGFMPANGMTYAPPHPCACYIESKLTGFNALIGKRPSRKSDAARLVKGPAYGGERGKIEPGQANSWPTYRSDNMRSGSTRTSVSTAPKQVWQVKIPGPLTPPVIADGKVYVSAIEAHTVHALESSTGKQVWAYTAGGRVDSPPTIVKTTKGGALCLFGCRDGWIYCLQGSDGTLVWRYRAVQEERRIVSYDQLESTWPVSGAVLVRDTSLYCVAGRSMFLDGGLRLLKLNVLTGEAELEKVMGDTMPGSSEPLHTTAKGLDMPAALPDILSSDGKQLYMRSQVITLAGKRLDMSASRASDQDGEQAHLLCSGGLLDDTWFHRAYWVFGAGYGTGYSNWFRAGRFAPAGRMLVFNQDTVFGYGRQHKMFVWSSALEYQLFAANRHVSSEDIRRVAKATGNQRSRRVKHGWVYFDRNIYGEYPLKDISAVCFKWRKEKPVLQARAMVLANKALFVCGPPDVYDEEDIFDKTHDPDRVAKDAAKQVAALQGDLGSLLHVVSTDDGTTMSKLELGSVPVFDGMAAAEGRLFIATRNGLLCLK